MPRYKIKEDENIYIDCNPVDTIGNEVVFDDYGRESEQVSSVDSEVIDSLTDGFKTGQILDNVGLQFTIAISVFAITYGLANYVFKTIPNEMLDKRLNNF